MSPAGITWIPYGEDAARVLADRLLARHEQDLPDLSRVDVLLPSLEAQTHFQTTLIDCAGQRGHPALLGPQISTLPLWTVSRFAPSQATPSPQVTGLMLVEALVPHQRLFGRANPWQVADALLNLFTLMSRQDTGPDETLADFETRLQQAYGGEALAPLSREARMVHTLWQAWREQLAAEGLADPQALYREALERAARHTSGTLYLVAPEALTPPEATCINRLRHEGRAEILLQGDTDSLAPVLAALEMEPTAPAPTDSAGDLVEQVFDTGETAPHLAERARRFAERVAVSPLTDRLATYAAPDAEQHARAIDVQTRLWLNEGKQHIGIVTDDRRLARRVRALLERAGLVLSDSAGWLLSTTSAAATLERWLECIEQDFSWQPLMDVLKSPFVFPATARDQALKTVYRLENDVIRHENVGRGLTRYQAALRRRAGRLPDWGHRGTQAAEALLNRLQRAAAPLVALHARPGQAVAHNYLEALQLSLERLGLARGLSEDPAGQRILETLTSMTQAAGDRDVRLDWAGFRTWLGRALEGAHFRPATQPGPVMLLSLPQARLLRFDALVLAGLDREHLPGREPAEVFFNNRVRRELGLPGWEDHLRRRQLGFRSLLESAPRVLLTWQAEDVDEPILPSPWVEAIEAFHILAYGQGLADPHLPRLSRDPRTRVGAPQPAPLPP
ncbi:MAG: DNA helicase, partial [Gammaproteobacteria bacterium]